MELVKNIAHQSQPPSRHKVQQCLGLLESAAFLLEQKDNYELTPERREAMAAELRRAHEVLKEIVRAK